MSSSTKILQLESRYPSLCTISQRYQCSLSPCLSFPFINTTFPVAISICLWLFFILCLSLRECGYCLFHLFQAASLRHLLYRCRFLIISLSSSNCSSAIVICCPCIRMFSVYIGNWISSSIYTSDCLSVSLCPVWLLALAL